MSVFDDIEVQKPGLPASDRQDGPQVDRFGSSGARGWKVAKMGVIANETIAGVAELDCIIESKAQRIQWMVLQPPGNLNFDVTVGRWLKGGGTKETKALILNRFVVDEVVLGNTTDAIVYQKNERDPVCLIITNIVDAPTGPPTGLTKVDATAVPDGFVVLYRAASRE